MNNTKLVYTIYKSSRKNAKHYSHHRIITPENRENLIYEIVIEILRESRMFNELQGVYYSLNDFKSFHYQQETFSYNRQFIFETFRYVRDCIEWITGESFFFEIDKNKFNKIYEYFNKES